MNKKVLTFFIENNLCDYDFAIYIEDKVVTLESGSEIFWYGCYPIVDEDGLLVDMRVVVPEIITEKDIIINIHEFSHAIELYGELGTIYEDRRQDRENYAKEKEKLYLNSLH